MEIHAREQRPSCRTLGTTDPAGMDSDETDGYEKVRREGGSSPGFSVRRRRRGRVSWDEMGRLKKP
jgi:hypothetical protein